MKFSVTFPSVMYRDGPQSITRLIRAIEDIGFHEMNVLDHVVMGYAVQGRDKPIYPAQMPLLEALSLLSYAAAVTERIGLATGVLVLPQRQAVLAAKQISTLDTLSGGRVRLGVGSGWQASEYDALQENFSNRGRRMDEAIGLLRACWSAERIDFRGEYYALEAMAMEPMPPQDARIPVWIGGTVPRSLRRVAELGDGWMGMSFGFDADQTRRRVAHIHEHAESIGRDPAEIGLQMSLTPPRGMNPRDYYTNPAMMAEQAVSLRELGFNWGTINLVELFRAGYRSVNALTDQLTAIHEELSAAQLPD